MTLSPEQRTGAVQYLSEGATFAEVWALIGASRRDAERDWIDAKRDAENGVESELTDWYREAAAARARIRATLRAEAREASGSREATDRLQVLAAISAEEEPTALANDGDVRASSPQLNLTDRIEAETDPVERERMKRAMREGELGLHALFSEVLRQEARGREVAVDAA